MGEKDMKHAAKLREWSARIEQCRSGEMRVKDWGAAQGISTKTYYYWKKQLITEAGQKSSGPDSTESMSLTRVNPDKLSGDDAGAVEAGITIRHGESVITLPRESRMEAMADLVKALNRHV